jgi:N-acetylmuramic acid 6-phosphate etherase
MLPRFRKCDDRVSPPSWAFVKNPLLSTPQAWRQVLRRRPRCLTWNVDTYRRLNAPAALQANPPRLAAEEMFKFLIGNEDDRSRYGVSENAAILVALGEEVGPQTASSGSLPGAFRACAKPFRRRAALVVGSAARAGDWVPTLWHVPIRGAASPLRLTDRLALKLVLNTVSTATMARMGRLASNWMVHVEPTNKKLIDRGTRLVAELAGVDYRTACYALHETIEEQARTAKPGQQRPSPVAVTIARLRGR